MSHLGSLVTHEDCTKCKLCCWFTKYDLWETPVIDDDLRLLIEERYPDTRFIKKNNDGSLFIMTESEHNDPRYDGIYDSEIYNCPMLSENGCKLGGDKPFECSIWPFRIMSQAESFLISVSCLCKPMCENSLNSMLNLLHNGLLADIVAYAKLHPGIIKEYNDGYPILMYVDI
jgi:Fe-S-cluster containining protein